MLNLAPKLKLPPDAALQRYGILAMSGAGKSNTSVVMAEEFYDAGIPWVAVDPKGDWWGIRATASGKGTGLEVPVFGGLHGDLPLEEGAGTMMAELIAETRLTCILDVSEMTKGAQLRFLTDFAETLLRRNREPLHVFAEEADEYLPQRVMKREAQCVGAWSKLVKRGRFRGIFVTLISQRSAALNNEALSQVDTLMPMRTAAPADKKAIELWVLAHGVGRELVDSLPKLKDGELWVWSPHKLGMNERVRFRRRRTFDSGATPGLEGSHEPAKLADIDLDVVRERMAETIEKAEAEDPKKLRHEVARLERELGEWKTAGLGKDKEHGSQLEWTSPEALAAELANRAQAEPIEVPVAVIDEEVADKLSSVLTGLGQGVSLLTEGLERADGMLKANGPESDIPVTNFDRLNGADGATKPSAPRPRQDKNVSPAAAPTASGEGSEDLGLAERKILGVLAQFPEGRTKVQIAILTGYSAKSGGFNNALGKLRGKELISAARIEPVTATPAGLAAAGEVDPLPTGPELLHYWSAKLGKAEREILHVLFHVCVTVDARGSTKQEIAEETGYSVTSGGFNNALGKLRSLELISPARVEPITISEVFL